MDAQAVACVHLAYARIAAVHDEAVALMGQHVVLVCEVELVEHRLFGETMKMSEPDVGLGSRRVMGC